MHLVSGASNVEVKLFVTNGQVPSSLVPPTELPVCAPLCATAASSWWAVKPRPGLSLSGWKGCWDPTVTLEWLCIWNDTTSCSCAFLRGTGDKRQNRGWGDCSWKEGRIQSFWLRWGPVHSCGALHSHLSLPPAHSSTPSSRGASAKPPGLTSACPSSEVLSPPAWHLLKVSFLCKVPAGCPPWFFSEQFWGVFQMAWP